jgi:hypothetical protein
MWFKNIGIHGQQEYGLYIRSWKNPAELRFAWTVWTKRLR